MKSLIKRCECGRYSLRDQCPECGKRTRVVIPPRFSPEDRYARYRRMLIREMRRSGICH